MRIFIAVPLPDAVKSTLKNLQVSADNIRWQPPHQLHITLKFLGDTSEEDIQLLKSELADVSQPSFALRLTQWGTFPEKGRPSVIWVGVEPEQKITTLHKKVEKTCAVLGFDADERPFVPHITLGRPKKATRQQVSSIMQDPEQVEFLVRHFGIYKSELSPEGAQHSLIKKYPLGD